jgi:hypothetical protein
MLLELTPDLLIFKYPSFEVKISLDFKPYRFLTETFVVVIFYIYILGFLVDVCWFDLHIGAVFVVLLVSSVQ